MSGHRTGPGPGSSIAFAWLYTAWGGAEIQMLHLARHAPGGTEITVIAPRRTDGTLRALWSEVPHRWIDVDHHIDVSPLPTARRRPARRTRWVVARVHRSIETSRAAFDLRRAAGRLAPDVVLVADLPPWSTFLAIVAIASKRPVVMTWHTPLPPLSRIRGAVVGAKLALLGNRRGVVVAAANDAAQLDAARRFGRPPSAIPIIPAGFDPGEIGAVSAPPEQGNLVVGVGALVERKGVDVAIDAIVALRARGRKVRLIWLGDGVEHRSLDAWRADHRLSDEVELRTPPPTTEHRIELLQTVGSAAVYVQPSRLEGLPLAVVEAMALGRPVVATRVGSMAQFGDDAGITWVPVDDAKALADAIDGLLADPNLRRALGERGRSFVAERFDMATVARAAYDFIATLGAARRSAPSDATRP